MSSIKPYGPQELLDFVEQLDSGLYEVDIRASSLPIVAPEGGSIIKLPDGRLLVIAKAKNTLQLPDMLT
jgi:hypothetical protein